MGGNKLHSEIHKLILFGIRKKCHNSEKKPLLYLFIKGGNYTAVSYHPQKKFIPYSSLKLTPYIDKITGIINVDFNILGQLLIRYSIFVRYWRKREYNGTVYQLFMDFKMP
jgi:hypothetical protein